MPVAAPLVPNGPSVADCDAKLDRYRAALDAGADPAVVAQWIAETQTERQRAQARQQAEAASSSAASVNDLTADDVLAMIEELGDMVVVLGEADPEHKQQVYRDLGLRLTYLPERQTVRADVDLAAHRWDSVRVRGGT
jgi:site-specific DNA recombinase